jgi:hypothetical protein
MTLSCANTDSNIHGMPSPGRNFNRITIPVVFLPTSYNYYSVYHDYVTAYKDKYEIEVRIMVESTFVKIWKALIPGMQFKNIIVEKKINCCM